MTATQGITPEQRYRKFRPCPVCGGHTDSGHHCHGFLSGDGRFANCGNEDYANGAESFETDLGTMYKHVRAEDGGTRPWVSDADFAASRTPTMFQRPANPRSLAARIAEAKLRLVEPQDAGIVNWDADAEWEAEEQAAVKAPKQAGKTTYEYGTHQIVRTDRKDADGAWEKSCIPRYQQADGSWIEAKLPDNPQRVYRRAELADRPGDTIYVVEGEKCVEAARAAGLTAITWLGGANAARKAHSQLRAACKGRDVVLLPDEEENGRKAMAGIATALTGSATSIKSIDLYPDTGHKRDIVDWLYAGNTTDVLRRYVAEAPQYEPPAEEPASAPKVFATYTPSQMKERPAITFAVENLIPTGGFASLVGAPGTYKSFIALDIAASIAARGHWQGRDATQGGVLYVSAEGASGLGQRIRAWETARRREIPSSFRIMTDAPQLREGDDVEALINTVIGVQAAIDVPLQLIVIDTFARTFNGEENSSKEVGEAIAAADLLRRASGAAILLIHHLNKAGTASRGSSALLGALDVEITATRSDHSVKLEVTKAKDFGEGEPILLATRVVELEGGGSSLVLDAETPNIDSLPAAAKNVALVLDDQFGELGAAHSVWKKACEEKSLPSETFNRALRQLIDKDYVVAPPNEKRRNHKYRLTRVFYETYGKGIPRWLDTNPSNAMPTIPPDRTSQSVPTDLLADPSQKRSDARPSVPLSTTDVWYQEFPATPGNSSLSENRYQPVSNQYHGTNASPEEFSTNSTTTHRVGTVVPKSEERSTESESTAEGDDADWLTETGLAEIGD